MANALQQCLGPGCDAYIDGAINPYCCNQCKLDHLQQELSEARKRVGALESEIEQRKTNTAFLLLSVGECHLMISRRTAEFQTDRKWEATDLPARFQKIMREFLTPSQPTGDSTLSYEERCGHKLGCALILEGGPCGCEPAGEENKACLNRIVRERDHREVSNVWSEPGPGPQLPSHAER